MTKKIKYLVWMTVCMCVVPLTTHAQCDYQRLAELSRIASNVQFNYTYDVSQGLSFTLYITNLTNDIYIVDDYGNRFSGAGEKSLEYNATKVPGFMAGDQVGFEIFSNDSNCSGESIITKYITFPKLNPYIYMDECKQYPNFKYCQMWVDASYLSYEEFKTELNNYLAMSETVTQATKPSIWNVILAVLTQPYVKIGGAIVFVIIIFVLFFFVFEKIKYRRR